MFANWEIAQKIQADAKRLEADMGALVSVRFAAALEEMKKDISVLLSKSAGPDGKIYLDQANRLEQARQQLQKVNIDFAEDVVASIKQAKAGTIESHLDKYADSVNALLPEGLRMNLNQAWPKAALALQKRTADGVPLSDKLPQISTESVNEMMRELQIGAMRGEGMYQLMRRVERAADTTRYRAEVIARNEVLMASRQAGDWTYAQFDSVIQGKRRLVTLDRRTCIACIAQDGREYGLDESMDDHVMGRCVFTAIVPRWADLGYAEADEPKWMRRARDPFTGENEVVSFKNARKWFEDQPEGVQQGMMGPGRWQLWHDGKAGWGDLFGPGSSIVPIRELKKLASPTGVSWYSGKKPWEPPPAGAAPATPPPPPPTPTPAPPVQAPVPPPTATAPEPAQPSAKPAWQRFTKKTPWEQFDDPEAASRWAYLRNVSQVPRTADEANRQYMNAYKKLHPNLDSNDYRQRRAWMLQEFQQAGIESIDPDLRLCVQNAINRNSTSTKFKAYQKRYGEVPVIIRNRSIDDSSRVFYDRDAGVLYVWNTPENVEYARRMNARPVSAKAHSPNGAVDDMGYEYHLRAGYGQHLWYSQLDGTSYGQDFDDLVNAHPVAWYSARTSQRAWESDIVFGDVFAFNSGPGAKKKSSVNNAFLSWMDTALPAGGRRKVAQAVRAYVAAECNIPKNGMDGVREVRDWVDEERLAVSPEAMKDRVTSEILNQAVDDPEFRDYCGWRAYCSQEHGTNWHQFGMLDIDEQRAMREKWDTLTATERRNWWDRARAMERHCEDIGPRAYPYAEINDTIKQWAHTSGDQDRRSLVLQKAVNDVFGMNQPTRRMYLNCQSATEMARTENDYAVNGYGYRAIIRAMYANTQEKLRGRGISRVTLYRGFKTTAEQSRDYDLRTGGNVSHIEMQPANSFTTRRQTALNFAGNGAGHHNLTVADIPAERILGTCKSGYGCWREDELVVLDTPGQMWTWQWSGQSARPPEEGGIDDWLRDLAKGYDAT